MTHRLPQEISRKLGFTLIELMVTIAVIAILASLGVTAYESFVEEATRESARANNETIDRALDNDFISISSGLGGPTSIAGAVVLKSERCFDYIQKIASGVGNTNIKNAYAQTDSVAINLHLPAHRNSDRGFIRFGQVGFMCADPCARLDEGADYYMHQCLCVRDGLDDETATGCQLPQYDANAYIGLGKTDYVMPCLVSDPYDPNTPCTSDDVKYMCPTPVQMSSVSECTD